MPNDPAKTRDAEPQLAPSGRPQLVHPNGSLPPLVKGNVELGISKVRGDGRRDEVVVSRIEKNHGRPNFAAGRLVKVDPNQNDFTQSKGRRSKCHGSVVRKPSRRERRQIRTAVVLLDAMHFPPRIRPTLVQPQPFHRVEPAMRSQAERQSDRLMLSLREIRQFSLCFFSGFIISCANNDSRGRNLGVAVWMIYQNARATDSQSQFQPASRAGFRLENSTKSERSAT